MRSEIYLFWIGILLNIMFWYSFHLVVGLLPHLLIIRLKALNSMLLRCFQKLLNIQREKIQFDPV